MRHFKMVVLTVSLISLLNPQLSYGFGYQQQGQGLRDLVHYRNHTLTAEEINELSSKNEGDATNPYNQCLALWGGKGEFHTGQKSKNFDSGSIEAKWKGSWDKLLGIATEEFNQPPNKDILKTIGMGLKSEIQSDAGGGFIQSSNHDAQKEIVLGYMAYIYSKYLLKGLSLLDHMGKCSAVYIMTSKRTDAIKGETYEPKSMGMMMMMGMGGMGGMGMMGGNSMMMGGSMSGMGNAGVGMMGGMNAMNGMNPLMMMMMGGSVKCQSMGPQTQDYHDCKRIVQMFDAAMIAQQGTTMAERVQMSQSQIDAQKKMLENEGNDGTVQLEVMKDQVDQQAQIAFTRAAFETIKTAGFAALWQNMPTPQKLKKMCLQNFPQNLGTTSFNQFIEKLKAQYEGFLEKKLQQGSDYLRMAKASIDDGINENFHDIDREIKQAEKALEELRIKSSQYPNCKDKKMHDTIKYYDTQIKDLETKISNSKNSQDIPSESEIQEIQNEIQGIQDKLRAEKEELIEACLHQKEDSDGDGLTGGMDLRSVKQLFTHNQNHYKKQQYQHKRHPHLSFVNDLLNRFLLDKALAQTPPQNPIPTPQGKGDKAIFDALKTIFEDAFRTIQGGGEEHCAEAYQEDFLPNQGTRDFAKMMAVQAGSMAASNTLKGGLATKQAGEIQSIIDNMKKKKDATDDGQSFGEEEMDTECKLNPELEKCKRYAGARQKSGFQGLSEKTLSGGAPGGIINTGGTSATFDKRKAGKGSADASKVGGAPGSFIPGGGGHKDSGFESPSHAPTSMKTKPNPGRGGGGSGMGGASAQSGGRMGSPSSGEKGGNTLRNSGIGYKKSPIQAGRYGNNNKKNRRRDRKEKNPFADLFKNKRGAAGKKLKLPKEVLPPSHPLFERVGDAYQRVYKEKRIHQHEIFY